jgi:adenylate cyclase
MRDELFARLRELGASDDDLARADAEGWLPLLAFDRVLMPGAPVYDIRELARRAGLDGEFARRLWRAVGFPDVPQGVALFTERDVDAARLLVSRAPEPDWTEETLLQQVRVISAAMARIAAVEAEAFVELVDQRRSEGRSEDQIAAAVLADSRLEEIAHLIDYVHRLQLRAAAWRRLTLEAAPDLDIAVAFADLSGYTRLSASLDAAELSALVGRWEALAYDTVAAHGARVVKTIGDEVMFVGLPPAVVGAALAVRDAVAAADLLPVRAGIAAGPVIARDGDFYGPVVNLASRLADAAGRGEILVPAALCSLARDSGAECRARGRRRLAGIGDQDICALERAPVR